MNISFFTSAIKGGLLTLLLISTFTHATGMVPESSVVIVEQDDGQGTMNVKNTDSFPVMLVTSLVNIPEDQTKLLSVTPPAARIEPGKTQQIRFIITSTTPLKTEHLKRVIFEGFTPQKKGESQVQMSIRQNLPVIIRPAGLAKDMSPWRHLTWRKTGKNIEVSNPSPYVVRLAQEVQTRPDNVYWTLPRTYVLPGQTLVLKPETGKNPSTATHVHISPATTWGFSVDSYDALITK